MDYEIPIKNNLVIGYYPVIGQPTCVSLYQQTLLGNLSGILAGVSRYGQLGRATYGVAENARSCMPRDRILLHDPGGRASVADEGPDISVSMPKAWFIVLDGEEVHLYSREDDWRVALAAHGVTDAQTRSPSRLRSPSVWYALGVLLALTGMLTLVASGALWSIRRFLRSKAAGTGRCRQCGYNLTGNVSGRCPECGTPIGEQSKEPDATDTPTTT